MVGRRDYYGSFFWLNYPENLDFTSVQTLMEFSL